MMPRMLSLLLLAVAVIALPQGARAQEEAPRFRPIDLIIDSGDAPLAAYQVEVKVTDGDASIVGVEGGEHAAFKKAPYYDPKALMGGRIMLAAFSTAKELPTGRQRVLTLHVREVGPEATFTVELRAAADAGAQKVPVRLQLVPRKEAE